MSDSKLLQQFVDSFSRLDDMLALDGAPVELIVKRDLDEWDRWQDESGCRDELEFWRPLRVETNPEALETLYARISGRFPVLYEQLVLSIRWMEVYLGVIRLLPNPPGADLTGLSKTIFDDRALTETLIPAGYVPFARAPHNYDPMCFDLNAMSARGDCPIIQFEHESILCDLKIGEHWQRWASFRDLMSDVIFLDAD
ncbi:hypothetical protein [uncultured Gimesia sp.]|uniref:hypothetical protein n=1 Tax=uncultured Gimesia sp. TaxID=1678688 RepID=UPI00262DDE63|nr:hypothetical protein [uncultured Gimesia sp.]